jgi:hypothetical protein
MYSLTAVGPLPEPTKGAQELHASKTANQSVLVGRHSNAKSVRGRAGEFWPPCKTLNWLWISAYHSVMLKNSFSHSESPFNEERPMQYQNPYSIDSSSAALAVESERTAFIRRTYVHLALHSKDYSCHSFLLRLSCGSWLGLAIGLRC